MSLIYSNEYPYNHNEAQNYALENVSRRSLFGDINHAITYLRNIVNNVIFGVDRQGIPSIPPGLALVGFSTAVAVAGVSAQTGITAAIIDNSATLINALSNIISK